MKILFTFGAALLIAIVVDLVLAIPLLLLWNWLVPEMLGLANISYGQAFGLLILCGLLFKSSSYDSKDT